MNVTRKIPGLWIIVLAMLACQMAGAGPVGTPTRIATSTRTPRPSPTPSRTATPFLIRAGTRKEIISGGFRYAPLTGFDGYSNNYEAYMSSPDETVTVLLTASTPFHGEHINNTLKYLLQYIEREFRETVTGDRVEIELDGVKGISADFSGLRQGTPFQGRATVFRPSKSKQLVILVFAHGEGKWDEHGEKAYTTTLENLSFFEITPRKDCPISSSRTYGYTPENPIKIGGEVLDGPDREDVYLSSLLGPHGELVSYYRQGSVNEGDLILDEYVLEFANQRKMLYLNIYDYETPKAPMSMTCSGPLVLP